MGMSASQARLIQLTARMSDLELEGQQINQQRLNLANQSAAIQEEALKMEVPTAPSTYNFMKDVYSGKDNNNNPVMAGIGSDGKPQFSVLADDVKSLKADSNKTGVQDKYVEADANAVDDVAKKGREVKVTVPDIQHKKEVCNDQSALRALAGKNDDYNTGNKGDWDLDGVDPSSIRFDTNYYFEGKESSKQVDDTTRPIYKTVNGQQVLDGYEQKTVYASEEDHDEVEYTNFQCSSPLWKGEYEPDSTGKTKEVTIPANGHAPTSLGDIFTDVDASKIKGDFPFTLVGDDGQAGSTITAQQIDDIAANAYDKANQQKICSHFKADAKGTTELKAENLFDANGKMKSGVKLFEKTDLEVISGQDAYDIDEIKGSDIYKDNAGAIDDLIERINNYALNQNTSNIGNVDTSNFRILVKDNGDGSYSFEVALINKDGKGNRSATTFDESYTEKAYKNVPADVTIDPVTGAGSAKITKSDGSTETIPITKSKQLDTDAYAAAEAEYKNQKAAYDHAQEEANTRVKKLQTIDKALELKLKRLDTERNALNTEIDAVKKVIQDNTDKSFKTFSG